MKNHMYKQTHVGFFFSWKLQNTKIPCFDFDRAPFKIHFHVSIIIACIHLLWEIKMSGEIFRLCWFSFFLETSIWQNTLYRLRFGAILIYFHVSIRIARIHLWEIIKKKLNVSYFSGENFRHRWFSFYLETSKYPSPTSTGCHF